MRLLILSSGLLLLLSMRVACSETRPTACDAAQTLQISVDTGHPWRPPFGLARVGSPAVAHIAVEMDRPPRGRYTLTSYRAGREIERHPLPLARQDSRYPQQQNDKTFFATVTLQQIPDEVRIRRQCANGEANELVRQAVHWPEVEAAALARPQKLRNPVDLGAILVSQDSLLLASGESSQVKIAAMARDHGFPQAQLHIGFEGGQAVELPLPLERNRRVSKAVTLGPPPGGDKSLLHISLRDGGRELWRHDIPVMLVSSPPHWPAFGAVETDLRYDAPILVNDPRTGAPRPSIDYKTAWAAQLKDIVVFLPNGSRLVFWRGANYVPLWAGVHNTAGSYQWAENLTIPIKHPDGSIDLPEPLNDKELRYSKVQIMESTASRIHVRWTYQATDLEYRVWGDEAVEDYYFYPDGFGTRVQTVNSAPGTTYQLTEFIILTPQSAYPFEVLPDRMLDILTLEGQRLPIRFPFDPPTNLGPKDGWPLFANPKHEPVVYRLHLHKDDRAAMLYFDPRDTSVPTAYAPFYDQGEPVTPVYWGNHWPLSRGRWTGWTINDDIHRNPAHNSVAGWSVMPPPLFSSESRSLDTLGRSRQMVLQRWSALIAMTDATDQELLSWAHSYSQPPSLTLQGAHLDFPAYSAERRALRIIADQPTIDIRLEPTQETVNPVFEIESASGSLDTVSIDGKVLSQSDYAWDGKTLWIKRVVDRKGAAIQILFR